MSKTAKVAAELATTKELLAIAIDSDRAKNARIAELEALLAQATLPVKQTTVAPTQATLGEASWTDVFVLADRLASGKTVSFGPTGRNRAVLRQMASMAKEARGSDGRSFRVYADKAGRKVTEFVWLHGKRLAGRAQRQLLVTIVFDGEKGEATAINNRQPEVAQPANPGTPEPQTSEVFVP